MLSSSASPPEKENTPIGNDSWSLCCIFLKACTIWVCVTGGEKERVKKGGGVGGRQFHDSGEEALKHDGPKSSKCRGQKSGTPKKPQTSPGLNQSHYLTQSVTHAC